MGREGLIEVATQSTQKAHYLAGELVKLTGFSHANPNQSFFKEFVLKTPIPAQSIIDKLLPRGIYAGIAIGENELMIAVTEKKTKVEIDSYIAAIKEISHV